MSSCKLQGAGVNWGGAEERCSVASSPGKDWGNCFISPQQCSVSVVCQRAMNFSRHLRTHKCRRAFWRPEASPSVEEEEEEETSPCFWQTFIWGSIWSLWGSAGKHRAEQNPGLTSQSVIKEGSMLTCGHAISLLLLFWTASLIPGSLQRIRTPPPTSLSLICVDNSSATHLKCSFEALTPTCAAVPGSSS